MIPENVQVLNFLVFNHKRMTKNFYQQAVLGIVFLFYSLNLAAGHLKGGEIRIEKANGPLLNYNIYLILYADASSAVGFDGGILRLGDGTEIETTANTGNVVETLISEQTKKYVIEIPHTFSSAGSYNISYEVVGRNLGIVNVGVASNSAFYIESQIVIDPFIGLINQPVLSQNPIDKAISGKAFFHSLGAYDLDGDSLAYALISPKQSINEDIEAYSFPNDQLHYEGFNYEVANEAGDGAPTFSIDAISGKLVWDSPGTIGEYLITVKVEEWRKIDNKWILIGFITRDMQIIVSSSENNRPTVEMPRDTCLVPGASLSASILAQDIDGHPVTITSTSESYQFESNAASFTTNNDNQGSENTFSYSWQTSCEQARSNTYKVFIKVKDDPPVDEGPGLSVFETWNIAVAGAPSGLGSKVMKVGEVQLKWSNYSCNTAKDIKIYRKSSNQSESENPCTPGIPNDEGFTMIGTVSASTNSFLDNNNGVSLDPNTTYCYRLVATFIDDIGGETYPSSQICVRPNASSIVTNIRKKGDKDGLENAIRVYPNPASTDVNIDIDLPKFQSLAIRLIDAQGKVYRHEQLVTRKQAHQISLLGMAQGIYIIQVKTNNEMLSRKLAIQ